MKRRYESSEPVFVVVSAVAPDLFCSLTGKREMSSNAEIVLDSGVKVDRFMGKPYQPANLADLVRILLALEPAA